MKMKIIYGALLLLMLNVSAVCAQGLACGGTDPDGSCPLDAWVTVLAGVAVVFAAAHLYRKQKHVQL
jgi:hypothetical protein